MLWHVWNACLFHDAILFAKCIEIFIIIFPNSITSHYLDVFFGLIFYQSFKNLKIIKHAEFNFHGIKKYFL